MERKVSEAGPTDPTQQWDRNLTRYVLSRRVPTYFSHRILAHSIQPTTCPMLRRSKVVNVFIILCKMISPNSATWWNKWFDQGVFRIKIVAFPIIKRIKFPYEMIGSHLATLKGCGSTSELWSRAWLDPVQLHLQKVLIFITLCDVKPREVLSFKEKT